MLATATIANFYKGDVVVLSNSFYKQPLPKRERTFIVYSTSEDGSYITGIRNLDDKGTMLFAASPEQAKLKERGNYFKHLFRTAELSFSSVYEEAVFWRELGMTEQVANPASGYYVGWSRLEALRALRDDIADVVFPEDEATGYGPLWGSAYRYIDREIGERIRRAELARRSR